jgi:hypothetical protein
MLDGMDNLFSLGVASKNITNVANSATTEKVPG